MSAEKLNRQRVHEKLKDCVRRQLVAAADLGWCEERHIESLTLHLAGNVAQCIDVLCDELRNLHGIATVIIEVAADGKNDWLFSVIMNGQMEGSFVYPRDVEVEASTLLAEAWDCLNEPNKVRHMALSENVKELCSNGSDGGSGE